MSKEVHPGGQGYPHHQRDDSLLPETVESEIDERVEEFVCYLGTIQEFQEKKAVFV